MKKWNDYKRFTAYMVFSDKPIKNKNPKGSLVYGLCTDPSTRLTKEYVVRVITSLVETLYYGVFEDKRDERTFSATLDRKRGFL